MVKVLHIASSVGSPGRVQMVLKNYYSHIDRDRVRFDFAVHSTEKGYPEPVFRQWGSKIYHIPHEYSFF